MAAIVHGGEEIIPPGGGRGGAVLNINNPVIHGIADADAMFAGWVRLLRAELETG
jgi:hypothetical protein